MSRRTFVLRSALLLAFGGVIGFLALRGSPQMQEVEWIPAWVGLWADRHGVLRNAIAFFGFGILIFTLVGRTARIVCALCLFATLLEVAQIWIPTRQFDWRDIVTSLAGILTAWLLVAGVARGARKWRR